MISISELMMDREVAKHHCSGFSLMELMIVIAILGVLSALALPAYNDLIKDNCLTANATTLVTSLHFSRSEASKRQRGIQLLAIGTDGGNEWGGGWSIQDNVAPGGGGLVLQVDATTCSGVTMDDTIGRTNYIYFPTGFINTPGVIVLCDDRTGEQGRRVSINATGRPNVSRFTCT